MDYLETMFALHGQTAVVTGGAGVIGSEMSRTLLRAGANVIVWGRTQANIDRVISDLKDESSADCIGMEVDAGDEAQVEAALAKSVEETGSVEILINCVGGVLGKSPLVETDIERFVEGLQLNLSAGLMVPTKVMAAYWMEQQIRGSIINLTSMTSYKPLSGVWAYDAAKAGVLNLTQAAANELAPYGIRVNAIAPGFFLGKQNQDLLIDKKSGHLTPRGQAIIDATPYKRFGSVEELAGVTLFLASRQASGFVTGVSIPVDGGFLVKNI